MPAYTADKVREVLGYERLRWCAKRKGQLMGSWLLPGESSDFIDTLNQEGWDIYVVLNPTLPTFCGVKPADKDIQTHRYFLIDLDPVGVDDLYNHHNEILNWMTSTPVRVFNTPIGFDYLEQFTGRGYQCWLRSTAFPVPIGVAQARWLLGEMAAKVPPDAPFRVDTSTSDASRLARWPETINHKSGRVGTVQWAGKASKEVARHNFQQVWPTPKPQMPNTSLTNLSELAPRLTKTAVEFLLWGTDYERHKKANATAHSLREAGVSYEVAEEMVVKAAELCNPPLNEHEAKHAVRTAFK